MAFGSCSKLTTSRSLGIWTGAWLLGVECVASRNWKGLQDILFPSLCYGMQKCDNLSLILEGMLWLALYHLTPIKVSDRFLNILEFISHSPKNICLSKTSSMLELFVHTGKLKQGLWSNRNTVVIYTLSRWSRSLQAVLWWRTAVLTSVQNRLRLFLSIPSRCELFPHCLTQWD